MQFTKGKGVYAIRNTINDKSYIGSTSRSFWARWCKHRRALRKSKHYNPYLQSAWNKYGEPAFVFEIVEAVENLSIIIEREQFWIQYHQNSGGCYNIKFQATPPSNVRVSEETRRKIGDANRGHKHDEAFRKMRSETMKGKASAAFRAGGAISKVRRYDVSLVSPDGVIYERIINLRAFSIRHGVTATGLRNIISGRAKWHHGWSLLSTAESSRSLLARAISERRHRPEVRQHYSEMGKQKMQDADYKRRCLVGLHSPEAKEKARQSRMRTYSFIDPSGTLYETGDLIAFCQEHGLLAAAMRQIYSEKSALKSYKGWRKAP